jgi:anti-sigma factor RsiW
VVEECPSELGVREVRADVDVLGVHVVPDGLAAAAGSLLEGVVERALNKAGVFELFEVAGEERAHELALPEDAHQMFFRVEDGQRGEAAVEHLLDGAPHFLREAQQGRFADEVTAETGRVS